MRGVMAGATRSSELEGLALLREDPWSSGRHFPAGMRGFADGMASGTDWRALRAEMMGLLEDRKRSRTGDAAAIEKTAQYEQHYLDRTLAIRWARDDLAAAVDWYVNELVPDEQSKSNLQRAVTLLHHVPATERQRVVDWFEQRRSDEQWDDSLVMQYTMRLAGHTPDAEIHRLAAMPDDESQRAAIVSAFVAPAKKDGQLVLRHEPGVLLRLMDEANLSEWSKAGFVAVMTSTGWSAEELAGLEGER